MDSVTRGIGLAAVVFLALALGGPFLMGGMMGAGHMGTDAMWDGGRGMMWGLGGLTMLAFWGLLILGVVVLVRLLDWKDAAPSSPRRESPLDIARRRYAAGELTREQFEQMRRDLGEG